MKRIIVSKKVWSKLNKQLTDAEVITLTKAVAKSDLLGWVIDLDKLPVAFRKRFVRMLPHEEDEV